MNDQNNERISKDEYLMKIAEVVSQRSTCVKRNVGAVLVKENHIISTGYNGSPQGLKHCTPDICVRKDIKSGDRPELCRGVHAEINCIIQAAIHGTSIRGDTTLYCTTFPCMACLKLIINAGIQKLVYKEGYNMENKVKEALLKESKLIVQKY